MKRAPLFKRLEQAGLKPYLHHDTHHGSFYIKFGVSLEGNLRVSNHPQRSRYAYRWNLRKDIKTFETRIKLGRKCYYYPPSQIPLMVKHMKAVRQQSIEDAKPQPFVIRWLSEIRG